jgi:hypothetical protein
LSTLVLSLFRRGFINIVIAFVMLLLLGFFILLFMYRQFNDKELFFKAFVIGIVYFFLVTLCHALPALFLGNSPVFTDKWLTLVFKAVIAAALPEEFIKYLLYRSAFAAAPAGIKVRVQIIVMLGLVFAFIENGLYLDKGITQLTLRFFTALPLHVLTSAIIVLYRRGLIAALIFHSIYDMLALSPAVSFLVVPLIIAALFIVIRRFRRMADNDAGAPLQFF